jgi:altronate dehydratase large subunit
VSFLGYRRPNDAVGVRNHIGIISTTVCATDLALWISQRVHGTAPFLHSQGCCQTKPDLETVTRTLISLGCNPNLAGVLVVGLGCESIVADEVANGIARSGKPVAKILAQKLGGIMGALAEGVRIAQDMVSKASQIKREEFPDSELVIGVKCGASDTTSGLVSNPVAGATFDLLLDQGGTCVFGETTEFMGAEHILARRAATPEIAQRIIKSVADIEQRVNAMGCDMRGGQPAGGNIRGGLSTIEEKSLGAIVKSGTRTINGFYEYGERVDGKGLFIVDSPGREPEILTALAAAGVQVILFSTGLGAPQGFPFVPIIKLTGNPNTYQGLSDYIDIFIDIENSTIVQAGQELYQEALRVASGKQTKAEIINYGCFPNILTVGPII